MGDRDPVSAGKPPDHDLWPVATPIAGLPERLEREPVVRRRVAIQMRRREVVARERELQVGQVAHPAVDMCQAPRELRTVGVEAAIRGEDELARAVVRGLPGEQLRWLHEDGSRGVDRRRQQRPH